MRITLLGPVRATAADGADIPVGGARLRALLARLALGAGAVVPVHALIADLWGDPPAEAVNALQALVYRLRRVLRGHAEVVSAPSGYRLDVSAADVDAHRFEALAAEGRRRLADEPEQAAAVLAEALGLWGGGTALPDLLGEAPFARAAAARLDDVRASAIEDRFDAELRLGRHAGVLTELEAACREHPLRESLAGLRMRALDAAGRPSEALAAYEELRAALAERLGADPSPALRELHLELLRGNASETEPARLPARLTRFIGRESELAEVGALLGTARLVTVVGPGGAGKTRLAVETAERHGAYARGRVWFVPLAGVGSGDRVAAAVLDTLGRKRSGAPAGGMAEGTAERVARLLGGGEALLVLDNCEHVVDAAAALAYELLETLPELRILATGREPLAVTGEVVYPLGSLDVPAPGRDLAEVAGAASVRLFLDRAAAPGCGPLLNASTVDDIVEICRRLDGLPLALELAAARTRSMDVHRIARHLDDRFRLLDNGNRAALPRQRTLAAVVEWSWDLLSEIERAMARRLAAFPAGATVEAAEAVCAGGVVSTKDCVYALGSLVDKSIAQFADGRYRMLETVRAYAAERLDESGERPAVTDRLVRHFLALAEDREPAQRTAEQLGAIALFDAEYDNMTAALQAAVDARDADSAGRLAYALLWHWSCGGHDTDMTVHIRQLLDLGDALPDDARAAFTLADILATDGDRADTATVRALVEECVRTGAYERSVVVAVMVPMAAVYAGDTELAARERERAETHPDPWVRATAHWMADFVHVNGGDWTSGEHSRSLAVQGFEAMGDRWGLALALHTTGQGLSLRGRHREALEAFARAARLSGELGTELEAAWYRVRLVSERMRCGDMDAAFAEIEAERAKAAASGRRQVAAVLLYSLAEWHRRAGDPAAADRVLDELAVLAPRLRLPAEFTSGLVTAGRMSVALARGDAPAAREHFEGTVHALSIQDDPGGAASVLAGLRALEGRPREAARALGMSEAIRGLFDAGEPELAALAADLRERLGDDGYASAYAEGAALPRPEALSRLAERIGPPACGGRPGSAAS